MIFFTLFRDGVRYNVMSRGLENC